MCADKQEIITHKSLHHGSATRLDSRTTKAFPSVCNDAEIVNNADDTVLYIHGKNTIEVVTKLTKEMENVAKWLNNSGLTLNVGKTVIMYLTNRHKDYLNHCIKAPSEFRNNSTSISPLSYTH